MSEQKRLSLCNLQELYTAFKEEHPNVNIGFSKFRTLKLALFACSAHQNALLLVDAMDWDLTDLTDFT